MEEWKAHFIGILNQDETDEAIHIYSNEMGSVSRQSHHKEVAAGIEEARIRKAAGPDAIFHEHIEGTQEMLLKHWKDLFNKCVQLGQIPRPL
jgi:hypothetical protein